MTIVNLGAKRLQGLKSDTVSDSLGSSADGTNNGVTLNTTNEKLGTGCYSFDANLDYTRMDAGATTFTDKGTIALWINATNNVSARTAISSKADNATNPQIMVRGTDTNQFEMVIAGIAETIPTTVTEGTWYHVAITWDQTANVCKAYLNGSLEATKSNGGTDFTGNDTCRWIIGMGYNTTTASRTWDGLIDDFGLWDKVLPLGTDEDTEGSIKWLYNTGTGRLANTITGGLKAYYSFDQLGELVYNYTTAPSTSEKISPSTNNSSETMYGISRVALKVDGSTYVGKTITSATWKLMKVGTLTGTCYCKIHDSSDNHVATATTTYNNSTLSSSAYEELTFYFSSPVTLADGHRIFVEYATDDGSGNYVKLGEKHTGSNIMPSGWRYNIFDTASGWNTGQGADYSQKLTPWAKIDQFGCKNNASSTSPLEALTGVRTNTIFEETDTAKYKWWDGSEWKMDGTEAGTFRGLFIAGYDGSSRVDSIEYITIPTLGNSLDFGDITGGVRQGCPAGTNGSRGLRFGGQDGSASTVTNIIDYVTISTPSNATDFGDMTAARGWMGSSAMNNNTRSVTAGGLNSSNSYINNMDYVTVATTGNASDFGDTIYVSYGSACCDDKSRGVIVGGRDNGGSFRDNISYITIATTGNATNSNNGMGYGSHNRQGTADSTRGVFFGGYNGSSNQNRIEYITISTLANAIDFGDMSATGDSVLPVADNTRAVIASTDLTNDMEYITIQTLGNSAGFGDMIAKRDTGAATQGY